jgi:signal transduction histidine kinase
MLDTLRKISIFKQLTEDELRCFINGTEIWLNPGEILFEQGELVKYFYVVLEGAIKLSREVLNQEIVLATYDTGMFFGELPLLAGTPHLATGLAARRSHMYCLHENDFWQMITICPSVRKIILGHMASRMQELQLLSQQQEKLIALGTLSAGLAHELNNPASAANRAAGQLHDTMKSLDSLAFRVIEQHLRPTQLESLLALKRDALENTATLNPLDPLLQIDLEDKLTHWLESRGVDDGWKFAPILVAAGLNAQKLELICEQLPANAFTDVLTWLETTLATAAQMKVLKQGITRVSEIVKAIKEYSYMDRASLLKVDVHEGLESTLTILSYKLKKHNITVIREYDQTLPFIQAYGSSLNQVWTNLIDNAIDALGEQGKVWVRTFNGKDDVVVEIADNGPGIPPAIQCRIFEPFFTTKEVGLGTGLGLDIVFRIVKNQHNGDIRSFSEPGNTRFQIRLPKEQSEKVRTARKAIATGSKVVSLSQHHA